MKQLYVLPCVLAGVLALSACASYPERVDLPNGDRLTIEVPSKKMDNGDTVVVPTLITTSSEKTGSLIKSIQPAGVYVQESVGTMALKAIPNIAAGAAGGAVGGLIIGGAIPKTVRVTR